VGVRHTAGIDERGTAMTAVATPSASGAPFGALLKNRPDVMLVRQSEHADWCAKRG